MKAMSSWSTDRRVANKFAKGAERVVVKLEGGSPYSTSLSHVTSRYSEKEVLLSGKNKLSLVEKKLSGKTLEVTFRAVGGK